MKTLIILVISSLFFSNISEEKENNKNEKIMKIKIEKATYVENYNVSISRTPIIITKRD